VRFSQGLYRLTGRINPKQGQTFEADGVVVLSGARALTSWQRDTAGRWYVTGQTQQGTRKVVTGEQVCETGAPRCNYPESLFVDDAPLEHVGTISDLRPGAWWFDYDADRIYMHDDPTGRSVETAVVFAAFGSGADDVTIRGFTVEKFATPTENAAIEAYAGGHNWLIADNTVRLNSAVGAVVRQGGRISNNRLLRNGQAGYGAGSDGAGDTASGVVIEGNLIEGNNWRRVNPFFSAGGGKIVRTIGARLQDNISQDNYGRGMWSDLDNSQVVYERNTVKRNLTGIYHEMGFSADIRGNHLECNGTGGDGNLYTGVLLTNVSDVVIERNEIIVCAEGNAISVREDGGRSSRQTDRITVRDNRVIFQAGRGRVGMDAYGGGVLGTVTFTGNAYHVLAETYPHWFYDGQPRTWPAWSGRFAGEQLMLGLPVTPSATPVIAQTATPAPTVMPETTAKPGMRLVIVVEVRVWVVDGP
jgi:hypothetical protein